MIQSDPPSWGLEQKREETRLSSKRREVPWVPLAPQNQIPVIFSPPPRYPPKNNIPRLLEESSIHCNPDGLDNWQQHFQCTNHLETEKESTCNKRRLQRAHSLGPRSQNHPQLDQHVVLCTSQNSKLKNNRTESQELVLPIEAQRNGKKLRKSVACENQQDAGPENEMKRFNAQNLVCIPLGNERRAPLIRQDKRWSLANEREWMNLQDNCARHDRTARQGVHNSRAERSFAKEIEWEITGFENVRQRVARKVTGSSMAALGNGRRAGAGQTRKVKRAD
ncbi:eukaryotic translation initiation factor 4b1 [Fagus crenata]